MILETRLEELQLAILALNSDRLLPDGGRRAIYAAQHVSCEALMEIGQLASCRVVFFTPDDASIKIGHPGICLASPEQCSYVVPGGKCSGLFTVAGRATSGLNYEPLSLLFIRPVTIRELELVTESGIMLLSPGFPAQLADSGFQAAT